MSDEVSSSWGKSLYNFFRSLKLAIVLILFITATSIISTLIPQGRGPEFYMENYPRFTAWLIVSSGFGNFFRSFLFLGPSVLFFLNLSTCTFHRLKTRLLKKARKRFGPDILHIGLLVMIIGGVVTAVGREEGFTMLEVGEKINVPGGYVLTLDDFEFLKYENGTPKDWISTVKIMKGEKVLHQAYAIEVNRPLKIGNVKIYQSSYDIQSFLVLTDPDGEMYKLAPGQMIPVGDEGYILRDIEQDKDDSSKSLAHFDFWSNHEIIDHMDYSVSESIDIYTIQSMESAMATGLQMVIDPGYYPILMGLLLLTIGLFITYIQKMGEETL
ncbi:MAG: cytochrome c biogenesis protein ResB [Spirochaetaceae bacterium]|nr:cytochrome c biogenesis protein ResB [Spirochaetaceae bacterium]